MINFENWFKEVKESKDAERINEFLIEIGKNEKYHNIEYLDYFIEKLSPSLHEAVKINIIFAIGQIGKENQIENRFISYLTKQYYASDRWIRNEIITSFKKISIKNKFSSEIIALVGNALNEDYTPIKLNALKIIETLDEIPHKIYRNLFRILNNSNDNLMELCVDIFPKIFKNENYLFEFLDLDNNYLILNQKGFRLILMIMFNSIINLKSFKSLIANSNWIDDQKNIMLIEIENYENLLLKRI